MVGLRRKDGWFDQNIAGLRRKDGWFDQKIAGLRRKMVGLIKRSLV